MSSRRSSFVSELAAAVKKQGLFSGHAHLILAVSGGADSVALLLALHAVRRELGVRITVAHLDHRLRGAAGRTDAAFVQSLSKRLGVACVTGASDVRRRARRKGVSLEMAAREARYRFLERTARQAGASAIVTAHTADDQAETVLLRLVRGSGPAGLAGIRAEGRVSDLGRGLTASDVALLRPLLAVSRTEIESFLKRSGATWREDVSNASTAFLRNRVRHDLLPLLEQRFNPSIRRVLCRTAEILGEEDAWMHHGARVALGDCRDDAGRLKRKALAALPPAVVRRVVRQWLNANGFVPEVLDFNAIERVRTLAVDDAGSREVALPGGRRVLRRYGRLSVESVPPEPMAFRVRLNVPGETLLPQQGLRVMVARAAGIVCESGTTPGRLPASASLSKRAVGRRGLYLRNARVGDRMQPYGMKGVRKLQDIFVDAKVPADRRGAVPVLECGGKLAWLPGYRIAHPFRVAEPDTPSLQIAIEAI